MRVDREKVDRGEYSETPSFSPKKETVKSNKFLIYAVIVLLAVLALVILL